MRPDHITLTKTSYGYAFWLTPTYNALVRRWRVSATCDGPLSLSVNGSSTVSNPELGSIASLGRLDFPRSLSFDEVLASQTATESGATVELDSNGDSLVVDSIECFELPRASIAADSSERGVNPAPFRSSQPIRADAFTNLYAGAMDADVGRRVLFQWAVPYDVGGATSTAYAASTTSATFSDLFDVAKPCLARKLYNDGDYTACVARVFAWVSPGGSGQFLVNSDDGTSSEVTITNTSPAWSNELIDVRILHEDLTTDDGIPAGGFDDVQFQIRATSGTLYVASAFLGE